MMIRGRDAGNANADDECRVVLWRRGPRVDGYVRLPIISSYEKDECYAG